MNQGSQEHNQLLQKQPWKEIANGEENGDFAPYNMIDQPKRALTSRLLLSTILQ